MWDGERESVETSYQMAVTVEGRNLHQAGTELGLLGRSYSYRFYQKPGLSWYLLGVGGGILQGTTLALWLLLAGKSNCFGGNTIL